MRFRKYFGLRLLATGVTVCTLGSSIFAQEEVNQVRFRFPGDESSHYRPLSADLSANPPYDYSNYHLVRAQVTRTGGVPINAIARHVYKKLPGQILLLPCTIRDKLAEPTLRILNIRDKRKGRSLGKRLRSKLQKRLDPCAGFDWIVDKIVDPLIEQKVDSEVYEGRCGVEMVIDEAEPLGNDSTSPLPLWWVGIPVLGHHRNLAERGYGADLNTLIALADGSLSEELLPTEGPWLHRKIVNAGKFDSFSPETFACQDAELTLHFESVPACDAILSTYSNRKVECKGSTDQMWYTRTKGFPSVPSHWSNELAKGDSCTMVRDDDDIGSYRWTWTYISSNTFHVSTSSDKVLDPGTCSVE